MLNYIFLAGSQGVKMKIQCLSRIYSVFYLVFFFLFFFFTVLENDIMALGMICLLWQGQGNLAMKNIRNLVYRLQCIKHLYFLDS